MNTDIDTLAQAIAERLKVPADKQLWDAGDIATCIGRSREHVQERVVCLPNFPAPVRIGKGRPAWISKEVWDWVLSQREEKGRPRKSSKLVC